MENEILLTKEGTEKLKAELVWLTAQVQKAKSHERYFYKDRIERFESVMGQAVLLSHEREPGEIVLPGAAVTLQESEFMDSFTFTIVHPFEANPHEQKISSESPVARALLGEALHSYIEVPLPGGSISYKIIDIQNCKR